MTAPIHILHLEDNPNDAELVQCSLEAAGILCSTSRVQNHGDFVAALDRGGINLILSDFSLPTFDGFSALKISKETCPDVPFILVSGTLGEEVAIESLQRGATDYVLKQRLSRLGPAVQRAMTEVTAREERRRLEEQFIAAQKMEVMGQLSGGVAHDFNNILAVILGYSDLLSTSLDPTSPLLGYAKEIRLASERAANLTRQLLIFSRKQKVVPVVLELNEVVAELDVMLRRLIDENIEMVLSPSSMSGRILADKGYVGQVIMNLVVNARDVMPNGGRLVISTSNVTVGRAPTVHGDGPIPGRYVMLSVSDTGTGMTPEVKSRLFEAFFTTKLAGKGTGLGLATVQTIVQLSGAYIVVHSEPGRGSTFEVYFPQVEEVLDITAMPPEGGPLPRGTETLMVVEDEPAVRQLACGLLEAHGYEVLAASNGQEGLRVAREHLGSPIRLVVTDVIMPLMNGKVMAEWLKATYPDLSILFTSGYTDDVIAHHGVLDPGVSYLPKPYTPAILLSKVRAMLDAATLTEKP